MSEFIKTRHIERTIRFLNDKAADYRVEFKKYAELDMPELAEWYKARGEAFEAAVGYIELDLEVFGENFDDPIAHLIGEPQ